MRSIVQYWAAVLCIVAPYLTAHAQQALDEGVRVELQRLKELCDQRLIEPDVCKEKQREILGLPPSVSTSPIAESNTVTKKRAPEAAQGFLGVVLEAVSVETAAEFGLSTGEGAIVVRVFEDSPADDAGVRTGNVIVALDGQFEILDRIF